MRTKDVFLIFFLGLLITGWLIFFQKQIEIFAFDYFSNKQEEIFLAQISQNAPKKEPAKTSLPLEFQAKSILSLKIDKNAKEITLYKKNINEILPIASLTKLMTALIVLENYGPDFSEKIPISKEAVLQEGDYGKLKVSETMSMENLLYSILIESSNDAAYALAEKMDSASSPQVGSISPPQTGVQQFLDKMNLKAKELGMINTNFANPTGLNGNENYSTSEDLVKLIKYIILNQPRIFEITSKSSIEILNEDGSLHHLALNTDELLDKIPGIVGGKTGYNEEALGCLVLVLKNSTGEYLINIILGSPDRFTEMKKLIESIN